MNHWIVLPVVAAMLWSVPALTDFRSAGFSAGSAEAAQKKRHRVRKVQPRRVEPTREPVLAPKVKPKVRPRTSGIVEPVPLPRPTEVPSPRGPGTIKPPTNQLRVPGQYGYEPRGPIRRDWAIPAEPGHGPGTYDTQIYPGTVGP